MASRFMSRPDILTAGKISGPGNEVCLALPIQGFLEVFAFFWGGGGRVDLGGGEHSVEDHYLHKKWNFTG